MSLVELFCSVDEYCVEYAKAAAGDKNVILIGASTNQQCIYLGLCDELHIGIIPVLLGGGLRMFEHIDAARITLDKIKVFESGARTDIWFPVSR